MAKAKVVNEVRFPKELAAYLAQSGQMSQQAQMSLASFRASRGAIKRRSRGGSNSNQQH